MRDPFSLKGAFLTGGIFVLVALDILCTCSAASAIPMFARRYGVPCSTCHTSPPRLNETGYRFRAAGFRMPEELGKSVEISHKLTDHIGFRLQPRIDVVRSSIGEASETNHDAELFASEGYLWYGPISKHFSAMAKVTFWPEESSETERLERLEGGLRFNYGSAENFIDVRAGVPHPLEGFEDPKVIQCPTRSLIQELKTANFDRTPSSPLDCTRWPSPPATITNTTIRGSISSGMRLLVDEKGGATTIRQEGFYRAIRGSENGGPDFRASTRFCIPTVAMSRFTTTTPRISSQAISF